MQELRVIVREELKPVEDRLASIQEDIDVLKEESDITRNGVNILLKWAEKADRVINVGLYDKN